MTGSGSSSFVDDKGSKSMVSSGGSSLKLGIDHNKLMSVGKQSVLVKTSGHDSSFRQRPQRESFLVAR